MWYGTPGMPRNRLAGGGLQVVAGRFPDLKAGESQCLPNLRSCPRRNGEREAHVFLIDRSYFPASITPASKLRTNYSNTF